VTHETRLHDVLLDLGLEDFIPLPEAVADPEVLRAIGSEPPVAAVACALVDLARKGLVQLWAGRWPNETTRVDPKTAEALLRDERSYSFDGDPDGCGRVYYVNVDNYRE
jgi:hypothetical protein